jgi:hypothetical protein
MAEPVLFNDPVDKPQRFEKSEPVDVTNERLESESNSDYQAWLAEREAAKPVAKDSTSVDTNRGSAPTQTSKSEVRVQEVAEDEVPQSYVWLPNGEVLLVDDVDLPAPAGNQTLSGHWEKDGKVYDIVAVYPRETTIREN